MDDRFGPTGSQYSANPGAFTDLEFTVPNITPGVYALKVVDEYGASTAAIYPYTVLAAPVTTVALRGIWYYPCCWLSFRIVTTESSFTAGPLVIIRDPSGAIWWMTTTAWELKGTGTRSVYYQDQLVNGHPIKLPLDAPLGSWNWTITYTPQSTGVAAKATGLFTVAEEPSMQTVLDRLDTMEATITGVVTTTEGDIIAVVNTKAGTIMTDLDALEAAIVSIAEGMVTISTSLGEVQTTISGLDMGTLGVDITSIKGSVATIKTNIGTVTTNVANLDAKVTSISDNVATVSTSLGTLQGTVTSIDGNVATIETDVGDIEADIADLEAVDMTPAWIAVVLSLVAAIAAVFAVITIRQKIAG